MGNNSLREGFGATLAAGREAAGLTTADVAERLKLTQRQIEQLESEDWSRLPGDVFVRGFVRNYARLLEIDPDSLLVPLAMEETTSKTITAPSTNVPLGRSPLTRWLGILFALALVFVLVVTALYAWLSQGEDALVAAVPVPEQPAPAQSQPTPPPVPDPAQQAADAVVPVVEGEATSSITPSTGNVAAVPATQPAGVSPVPAETAPPVDNALYFKVQDDAWIQVVDSNNLRYSRLLRSGEEDRLSGVPPYRLVVGNAAQVDLRYKGQRVDLVSSSRDKVARLTLE